MSRKPNSNLLTMATIIVVAISIPVTLIILQSGNLDLRIKAFDDPTPQDVLVTDVKDDSFRVSWTTEKPVQGGVKLVGDERAPLIEERESSYHSLVVERLLRNTEYKFRLLSDGEEYGDGLDNYKAKTVNIIVADGNYLIYGQIFAENGFSFQQEGMVSLVITDGNEKSQKTSQILNEAGGFQMNLYGLLNSSQTGSFNYAKNVDLEFKVYLVENDEPLTRKFTVDLSSTRQLPGIYLGDVSFKTIPGIDGL